MHTTHIALSTTPLIPGGFIAARFLKAGDIFYRKDVLCQVRAYGTARPSSRVFGAVEVQVDVEDGTVRTLDITAGLEVQLMDEVTPEELAAYCGGMADEWVSI